MVKAEAGKRRERRRVKTGGEYSHYVRFTASQAPARAAGLCRAEVAQGDGHMVAGMRAWPHDGKPVWCAAPWAHTHTHTYTQINQNAKRKERRESAGSEWQLSPGLHTTHAGRNPPLWSAHPQVKRYPKVQSSSKRPAQQPTISHVSRFEECMQDITAD